MVSCFKGKFKVTSPRGNRVIFGKTEFHKGLDLVAMEADKSVYAIADGKVDVLYEANGFGYYIRQLLPDGRRLYYGHLAKGSIVVKAGQTVKAGDKLGKMGSTGRSTGAHTHIELRAKGTSKDSLDIAEFTGIPNKVGTYIADTLAEDLNILTKKGVINSPDYWKTTAPTVKYLPELIHNMAEKLK